MYCLLTFYIRTVPKTRDACLPCEGNNLRMHFSAVNRLPEKFLFVRWYALLQMNSENGVDMVVHVMNVLATF
jgi:hypothetical protein